MIDKWFLSFTKDGKPDKVGTIISMIESGVYLMLLKNRKPSDPNIMQVVHLKDMFKWMFFDKLEDITLYINNHFTDDEASSKITLDKSKK